MKIVIVPVLKKLAAALLSLLPFGEIGIWLLNAGIWTLAAIGVPVVAALYWFFVRYLPNRRIAAIETLRARTGWHRRLQLPPLKQNAGFRAKLWRGSVKFCYWMLALVVLDSKESSTGDSRTGGPSASRTRKRPSNLEPDAGPHRSFRQGSVRSRIPHFRQTVSNKTQ